MSVHTLESAIEAGRIDKNHHDRLLAGLAGYAQAAGIAPYHVYAPVKPTCSDHEVEWLVAFKSAFQHSAVRGFVYHGEFEPSVMDRMQILTGWLLRNYVNGRVVLMHEVIACLKEGEMPRATVLMIPDFYVGPKETRAIPDWVVGKLYGMLLDLQAKQGIAMLGIADMKGLEQAYGHAVATYVAKSYEVSQGAVSASQKESA